MATFGLVTCFALLIAIQHLQNWWIRRTYKNFINTDTDIQILALLVPCGATMILIVAIVEFLKT